MSSLLDEIEKAQTIAITGHTNPDGDCVGACLGLYNYILDNYKEKKVVVYLEPFKKSFENFKGALDVKNTSECTKGYDLFIALDCGDMDRFTQIIDCYESAKRKVCIDHHVSNVGYGDVTVINPKSSSTCELLYTQLLSDKISLDTASALYLGIVHDTGVFKHSNTTKNTMIVAGELLEKGVNSSAIIDGTFYEKTYVQNQLLGRALLESIRFLDGKCIVSCLRQKVFDFYQATSTDLDGIVDQLRITKGVEVAIFIYEKAPGVFKVSMRSNNIVDVSAIAVFFGGGGHVRAAGCTISGTIYDVINNVSKQIETQLLENKKGPMEV